MGRNDFGEPAKKMQELCNQAKGCTIFTQEQFSSLLQRENIYLVQFVFLCNVLSDWEVLSSFSSEILLFRLHLVYLKKKSILSFLIEGCF